MTTIIIRSLVVFILLAITTKNSLAAKKEVFFTCDNGFQYESKKDASRCIKQKKLSYRAPLACGGKKASNGQYRLVIDKKGAKDLCVLNNKALKARQSKTNFPPSCQAGYKLHSRRGKDACGKGNAEQIKPPSKKVSR